MSTGEVIGTSLFEVAAAGLAQMREAGFVGALAPDAIVRVEVHVAPVVMRCRSRRCSDGARFSTSSFGLTLGPFAALALRQP